MIREDKIKTALELQAKITWEVDNYDRALIPTHVAFKNTMNELTREELLFIFENQK
jgi:hypothetical protein